MHGRELRGGEFCERRRFDQHMPATTTRTVAASDSCLTSVTADSFCKDGRKIGVGDCALFKPPHDSPPFIGIIRRLTSRNDNILELGVNWLYRPAELELGKGILPEAAPNEIFYSFHRDEIPAASLLHPCKVAFLPKVVELPTGISSFVCRRVYDIDNKCLWWLTDQDYINERQEEVDQLLHKTRLEMHTSLQPGGRSPKPTSVPMSTSHSKPGSDNSVTSFSSQVKGKRRERGDQGSDQVKRERSLKLDDSDSGLYKTESVLKSEISKITERGGLVDFEGVEKLVQLMQPDRVERKMDLISRSVLAGVVAATDKFDCLNRFVQLRGLPVLDEWLQDVHKGKVGDGNPKDGDKYVEEFLLVLLRALDKLPVNLQALQMCNIGKSVNHLRSHKNMDIQKKARSLVDTWKKRVEAEMNMIDSKSGSTQTVAWPSKTRLPEASHSGNKNPGGGSNDVTAKSSVPLLSASKSASLKPLQGESIPKSASSSPGPLRSPLSPAPGKDSQTRLSISGAYDVPLIREDKSSSPNQSHNHGQSLSGKEDARSYTAVSTSNSKISNSSSRHRKSVNGFPGTSVSGGQKENVAVRGTSLHKNSIPEKLSQSAQLGEKAVEVPVAEGSSHKLIVKIPNRGRSPTHTVSAGSYEDPNIMNSRASSPVVSEKHDQFDRNAKEKSDAHRSSVASDANSDSWHSNDFKDILTGSDEGDGSPAVLPDEGRSKTVDDVKPMDVSKIVSSTSGTELKSGKLHEASFSSMNALVESCAKYSESNASMSIGDAVGMNLLASVATEEMSKTDMTSPSASQRNSPAADEGCMSDDSRSKSPHFDSFPSECNQRKDNLDDNNEKKVVDVGSSWTAEKFHPNRSAVSDASGDIKPNVSPEANTTGECDKHISSLCIDSKLAAGSSLEMNERSAERDKSSSSPSSAAIDGELNRKSQERRAIPTGGSLKEEVNDTKLCDNDASMADDSLCNAPTSMDDQKRLGEGLSSNSSFEGDRKNSVTSCAELNPCVANFKCIVMEKVEKEEMLPASSSRNQIADKVCRAVDPKNDRVNQSERQISDQGDGTPVPDARASVNANSGFTDKKERNEDNAETGEIRLQYSGGSLSQKEMSGIASLELEKDMDSRESKLCGALLDKTNDPVAIVETSSVSAALSPDTSSKMKFDLNEGFVSDDGKYGEVVSTTTLGCSTAVHVMNQLPFPVTSMPSSFPASITVAAAAKGPFVPPEELLRFKGEIGWKGSAATSAFRPAEPRKVLDMPLSSVAVSHSEASSSKQSRPLLDFDLNVPDERVFEEIRDSAAVIGSMSNHTTNYGLKMEASDSPSVRSSGGLDLDLNKADEPNDVGQCSVSSVNRFDGQVSPIKPSQSGASREVRRDFDLNNGPGVDDASVEQSLFLQSIRGSINSQPATSSLRMNNQELGSFSSWVPQGNPYSTVTIPSHLPDRGDQSFPILAPGTQRILGHAPAGTPFPPDVYRGSVLSSSPAVPFQSMFPFGTTYPFGTSFPLPSATYSVGSNSYIESASGGRPFAPLVNSQLLGPISAVSSQFPRPYMVGHPNGTSNGGADIRKWSRQGLDLNAGPGAVDIEGGEETVPLASRQHSVVGSQALAEESSRLYPIAGGSIIKRKEPEGGWDNDSFRYKPSSWQ